MVTLQCSIIINWLSAKAVSPSSVVDRVAMTTLTFSCILIGWLDRSDTDELKKVYLVAIKFGSIYQYNHLEALKYSP